MPEGLALCSDLPAGTGAPDGGASISIPYKLLVSRGELLHEVLGHVLGSYRSASMVILGMRLQAHYGVCFASARFLGEAGGRERLPWELCPPGREYAERKRWYRALRQLKHWGVVRVQRRIRPDGSCGTNVVDFGGLWVWLRKHLRAALARPGWYEGHVRHSGAYTIVKGPGLDAFIAPAPRLPRPRPP